MKKNKYKYIIN